MLYISRSATWENKKSMSDKCVRIFRGKPNFNSNEHGIQLKNLYCVRKHEPVRDSLLWGQRRVLRPHRQRTFVRTAPIEPTNAPDLKRRNQKTEAKSHFMTTNLPKYPASTVSTNQSLTQKYETKRELNNGTVKRANNQASQRAKRQKTSNAKQSICRFVKNKLIFLTVRKIDAISPKLATITPCNN